MFVVWGLYALVALSVLVTYWRLPPEELYNVSHDGLAGGAGRMLVFLNFPTALMAIAVLALVTDRLYRRWPAVLALGLCLVILVPGVVDENDLDAKWINVLPALGVAIVLALTVWSARVDRIGGAGSARGDRMRIAVVVALAFISLPWIFAEVGFYVGDVPGLGSIFRSEEIYEGHPSVHLGEHHGFQGFLLVVTALLLSRQLPRMHATWLRTGLAAYLSLMIAYGVANIANDGWLEQVVKRGWTAWAIPSVLRPELTWMWALVLAGGAAIYFSCFRVKSLLARRAQRND